MFDFDVITGPNPLLGQPAGKTALPEAARPVAGSETAQRRSEHAGRSPTAAAGRSDGRPSG